MGSTIEEPNAHKPASLELAKLLSTTEEDDVVHRCHQTGWLIGFTILHMAELYESISIVILHHTNRCYVYRTVQRSNVALENDNEHVLYSL